MKENVSWCFFSEHSVWRNQWDHCDNTQSIYVLADWQQFIAADCRNTPHLLLLYIMSGKNAIFYFLDNSVKKSTECSVYCTVIPEKIRHQTW